MALEGVRKELDSVVDMLVDWVQYIRDPRGSALKLISTPESEQSKIKRAIGVWVISFVVSLIVLIPVYHRVGISFNNIEYQLPAFLFLTGSLICAGASIHVGFGRYGIRSDFGCTLLVYTVFFGCYSPLFNLLAYPSLYAIFPALRQAKSGQLGLYDTVAKVVSSLNSGASVSVLSPVASFFVTLGGLLLLGIFAGTMAEYYGTTRKQILISLSFSLSILALIPTMLLSLLWYFLIYTFSS